MQRMLAGLLIVLGISPVVADDRSAQYDLTEISRTIGDEPEYQSQPRYALLVFGSRAEHRSWLVVDGDNVAYIDRNGDGDLTDPGERIDVDQTASDAIRLGGSGSHTKMHVLPLGEVAGTKLVLHFWVRNREFVPESSFEKYVFEQRQKHDYENASLYRIVDGGGAQIPVLLMKSRQDAQISHLNGPLTFQLKWNDRQSLNPRGPVVFDVHIGTHGLPAKGVEFFEPFSSLAVAEIPQNVHPVAFFRFVPKSGDRPVARKTVDLDERCCGDTALARFVMPKGVEVGDTAHVTVTYQKWIDHHVQAAEFEFPIHAGRLPGPWEAQDE